MNDELEVKNAKITGTMLGKEDHGVMTFYIYLDYGGMLQGFGGYVLDRWVEKDKTRRGSMFGMEAIRRILEVLEIETWEKLPGTPVRVKGSFSEVRAIGNYLKDSWVDLRELGKQYDQYGNTIIE